MSRPTKSAPDPDDDPLGRKKGSISSVLAEGMSAYDTAWLHKWVLHCWTLFSTMLAIVARHCALAAIAVLVADCFIVFLSGSVSSSLSHFSSSLFHLTARAEAAQPAVFRASLLAPSRPFTPCDTSRRKVAIRSQTPPDARIPTAEARARLCETPPRRGSAGDRERNRERERARDRERESHSSSSERASADVMLVHSASNPATPPEGNV